MLSLLIAIAFSGPLPPLGAQVTSAATAPAGGTGDVPYTFRDDHDPNGIGKFYMGREIAQVMGHEGADWLDRPEREREEHPSRLVELLGLRPGDVAADIGAGTGYITTRMARKVGPHGRVQAVDVQPEMLAILRERLRESGIRNVDLVLGREDDPRLPERSIDLALFVDVYHELAWPREVMRHIVRALKPGGRVVLVEYRLEDPEVPIKRVHKMTQAQAISEMRAAGLRHEKTIDKLPRQHVMFFVRPAPTTATSPAG